MSLREQFEAAVIKRMKESGFMEVEIRVECLARSGDGYADSSVDAYWHFWRESRAALVIKLPEKCEYANTVGDYAKGHRHGQRDVVDCIEAAGVKVAL